MGGIVIVDSVSGGTTDGANKDLSNLTVTGEAKFKAPALISSDAGNGLTSGTDDKLYIDVDVSGKANVDLDNITSAGNSVITSLITSNITGKANTDLSNLSATGEARFTAKATGYIKGFTCVMPSSTTFRFSYGVAEVDGKLLKLSTVLNKTMSSWSAGNNGGSLDTGVKQNSKWYFVYAIGKTNDDTAIDIITTLSTTNPLMPSGWDLYRLVDVIYIDASGNVVSYFKFGDGAEVQHNLFSNAIGLTATPTAQTVTLLFPPIKDRVLLSLAYQIAGASGVVVEVNVDTGSGTDLTSQVPVIGNYTTNLFRNPIVNGNDTSIVRYYSGADSVPNFRLVLSSFTFLR